MGRKKLKEFMRKIEELNIESSYRICEFLSAIEHFLNSTDIKLSSRPMAAMTTLLKGFISVENGPTEEPHLQEWFAVLFAIVMGWNEKKYGVALKSKTTTLKGIIEIHGIAFTIDVPETYSVKDQETGFLKLCFDPSIDENKTPGKWIVEPPVLENLTHRQSSCLDRDLRLVTQMLRSINLNLMLGDPAPDQYKQFCAITLISICKAAEKIPPQCTAVLICSLGNLFCGRKYVEGINFSGRSAT